jgi:hypothetical protein
VDPRAGLDAVVKRKIPTPRLESNPIIRSSSPLPVAVLSYPGSEFCVCLLYATSWELLLLSDFCIFFNFKISGGVGIELGTC